MNQHPETDELLQYVLAPVTDTDHAISTHLVNCSECRARAGKLSGLSQQLKQTTSLTRAKSDVENNYDSDLVAAYIDSRLDPEQAQQVEMKIHSNPAALKAALHYVTHSAAMKRDSSGIEALVCTKDQTKTTSQSSHRTNSTNIQNTFISGFISGLSQLVSGWLDWKTPAWISVPVTAVIVFTVTLLWLPQHDKQITGLQTATTSTRVIASYQDDPVIIISAAGAKRPGIGFFNTVPTVRKPFSPVTIVFNQDTLDMQWPDVQQATQYQVQLSVYRGTEAEPILNQTTTTSTARFDHFNPESGHRYEWTISGVTLNNATFKANGGFVIQ